jgi:hypothetical protein
MRRIGLKRGSGIAAALTIVLLIAAAFIWRDDILRTALDPQEPFQTYVPPPAPDYAEPTSWALLPDSKSDAGLAVDVFFIHPTTFNGGAHWNGPIHDPAARTQLDRVMLPNYAGPYLSVGRVFAPLYRQASLYSYLTLRDDAREARRFAYGDVKRAFVAYLQGNPERPFVIVGVEQGGFLGDRLLREVIGRDPALIKRLAAAYLIRTVVAADDYGPNAPIPACQGHAQAHCVVAFAVAPDTGGEHARELLGRSLLWGEGPELENLKGRKALCVNPLLGAKSEEAAPEAMNRGASNATLVEWGVRPAFLPGQVSARCVDGLLRVSRPKSQSLRPSGDWADRLKAPAYNLFFADQEADAQQRVAVLLGIAYSPHYLPPITQSIPIGRAPIHRID